MSLNNFFKKKQQLQKEKEESEKQQKKVEQEQKRNIQSVKLKARASERIENFQDTMISNQFVETMKNGSYPLLCVSKHSFRDREKEKELDKLGGIYLKTFQLAKDRASTAQKEFFQSHLSTGEFEQNPPNKNYQRWLRPPDLTKQEKPLRFGLGERSEVQRLNKQIKNISAQLDFENKDLIMLNYPSWKDDEKSKWLDNKTFNIYPCLYEGPKSYFPWKQHPINLNNQNNQYIEGYEIVGDLSRKREKNQEHKRSEFISTVKEDQFGTTIHISRSLRSMKQDKILNMQSNYDEYSTNKQIEFYKTTLLQTKSIDHVTPHEHSNNYKGHSLHNLRPQQPYKLYRQSINYLNQKIVSKQPPEQLIQSSSKIQDDQVTSQIQTAELFLPKQKLTQIQEIPHVQITSQQSNKPFSRDTLNSQGGSKSRFMDQYNSRRSQQVEIKLGYPYRLENDETTAEIMGKYFNEEQQN
ncbi:unnamed protein product [Paramecium primaurelia]|uniref:Uncharacterized protein n=1 Tax=Paramecium primaurelia TaxID=5886 RepID=A0A8S1LCK6_PARPR|nr:unnamed protein product [Paramecium primaurelia]